MNLEEADLDKLDVLGLLSLAQYVGVVPMTPEKKSLTKEVIKKTLVEFMTSA